MKEFNCSVYRGGTSKALCFLQSDLPEKSRWDEFLCEVMGGYTKQIDGMGGANSLTSKVAIISPGNDCINYTFAQVAIDKNVVDYKSNCGNISSAVGPFAYESGLVKDEMLFLDECDENHICLKIFNTNTKKYIKSRFKIKDNHFDEEGDCVIAGVPGSASKIEISFLEPEGSLAKGLLPTKKQIQTIQTSFGKIEVSIIDAGAALVFIQAKDVLKNMLYDEISNEELEKIEEIRSIASEILGLANRKEASFKNPAIPKVALVDFSYDYLDMNGQLITRYDSNIAIRMISMQKPHQAIAITGTVCTAMASKLKDSLVYKYLKNCQENILKISHPSGVIECEVLDNAVKITRTARKLMKGVIYTKSNFLKANYEY